MWNWKRVRMATREPQNRFVPIDARIAVHHDLDRRITCLHRGDIRWESLGILFCIAGTRRIGSVRFVADLPVLHAIWFRVAVLARSFP